MDKFCKNRLALRSLLAKIVLIVIIASSGLTYVEAFGIPKKEKWDYWTKSDEYNTATIDHSAWKYLLQNYVVQNEGGTTLVRYGKILIKDRNLLGQYINYLSRIAITKYARDEQMAYWINLYNALTWNTILLNYPVKSIRKINISPGTFSIGPWGKKMVFIENHAISLNDIEHRILRPIWGDDRIHYALNCASIGCPSIGVAFVSSTLEQQLDDARYTFINEARGVRIKENGDLLVSSIYKWFKEDFAYDDDALVAYFAKHAEVELEERLKAWDPTEHKIRYQYDWALNDSK